MFKMRKPYDKKLLKAIHVGVDYIDLRGPDRKKKVSHWLYFLRKKKETKAFDVKCAASNIFMIMPRKKIIHRKDKVNKRYSYFEIQ